MNITRKRGDTVPDVFTLTDKETWEPANLNGYVFTLTVDSREFPDDNSTVVYQLTGTSSEPYTGTVKLAPTEDQSDLVGVFYYDLEASNALGQKLTVVSGKYVYEQDITK